MDLRDFFTTDRFWQVRLKSRKPLIRVSLIMSKKVVPGIHSVLEVEEEVVEDIPSHVVKTDFKFLMLTGRERNDFNNFLHKRRNDHANLCLFFGNTLFIVYAMLLNLHCEDILRISLAIIVLNTTLIVATLPHMVQGGVKWRWKYYEQFLIFYAISYQAINCITTLTFVAHNTQAEDWENYTSHNQIPPVLYVGLLIMPLLSTIMLCVSIEVAICMW